MARKPAFSWIRNTTGWRWQNSARAPEVLDCFTHTGSFALNAGHCRRQPVCWAWTPPSWACDQARENAALNGLSDRVHFVSARMSLTCCPSLEKQGEKFDVVILDPPAFTKSRNSVKNAVKGYREINLRGMKLVKDGGYLATCSCSHFMDSGAFYQDHRTGRCTASISRLRQVEFRTQAPDHPILWGAGDSYYLKFYIFQVCEEK